MSTLGVEAPARTRRQTRRVHMHDSLDRVHDSDRRRDALATGIAARLGGVSQKRLAKAMRRDRSTINRHLNGMVDTPVTRFREYVRDLLAAGANPLPLFADGLAEWWHEAFAGWSTTELLARKSRLHREDAAARYQVDVWRYDDLEGISPACERIVDESILEQATRLVELYAIRQELQLRGAR